MPPETDAPETPAEFTDEASRENHVRGLIAEKAGYELKSNGAKAASDAAKAELYANRASQVDIELKRLGADARPASARAERR